MKKSVIIISGNQNFGTKITLELRYYVTNYVRVTFQNFVIKQCKWDQKVM